MSQGVSVVIVGLDMDNISLSLYFYQNSLAKNIISLNCNYIKT